MISFAFICSHGNDEVFSCRGIEICVREFQRRGHDRVTVLIPQSKKAKARINTADEGPGRAREAKTRARSLVHAVTACGQSYVRLRRHVSKFIEIL